ncbi:Bromodomain-containing protein [Earliella scabrosa]|nr:Bromodomain-containing protein [Earliella scabrosa]
MSKREARSFAAAGVDVDAPRAKRRKEAPATSNTSPESKPNGEAATANGAAKEGAEDGGGDGEDRETVREKGLALWQTLKDAVNKEGQIASFQFMRLPSKRQYPDYYVMIKHPIALDDIKHKLDAKEYESLKDVMDDFETCFRNAKRYNMRESQIWRDAKFLHKLAAKEYNRIAGHKAAGHEDGDGGSDDEEEKKKTPTIYKLLKTRLQKLVDKKDAQGRVLSVEFMVLPNRKTWPMYYTIIKKPQCLDAISKKLKRKEYSQPVDFANDVELVFSNALEFNQEHTQIWEDAVTLREHFRKLMADLPEPFSIPAYANSRAHPTKIKLKVPALQPPVQPPQPIPIAAPAPSLPSSNSIVVRGGNTATTSSAPVPAPSKKDLPSAAPAPSPRPPPAVKAQSATPAIPPPPAPAPAQASSTTPRAPALAPIPSLPTNTPQAQKSVQVSTLQPQARAQPVPAAAHNALSPFYPNAVYQPPALTPAPPKAPSTSPAIPVVSIPSVAATPAAAPAPPAASAAPVTRPSPVTVTQYAHPLKHAIITTLPHCRRLVLHHADGVRSWAMRLSGHETTIVVSAVTFLDQPGDEEESSGDDEPKAQEEEEEEAEEAPPVKKRGPGRPRKRRRGKAAGANSGSPKKKSGKGKAVETRPGEVQVKLNGVLIPAGENEMWEVLVPFGVSQLEIGEKGGMVWRVYLDRAAA